MDPFAYIPPTDTTRPKHAAIDDAHKACSDAFGHVLTGTPWLGDSAAHYDAQAAHRGIGAAAKSFYDAIQAEAPASADRSAAERCVRLARMHANEAIRSEAPADPIRRAFDALADARLQANAAIALEGR